MQKYKYILCTEKKVSNVISFIRRFWDKNHIFVRNKKLFKWQYKNLITKKYNFVLCEDEHNKIIGILGFIPLNQFSKKIKFKTAAWLSFWRSINENKFPGIGLGMINFLEKKIGIRDILNIGLNNAVLPIFKYLKYTTGALQHHIIVNSKVKKFIILKNFNKKKNKKKIIKINEDKNYKLQELSKRNLKAIERKFKNRLFPFSPKKDSNYIINRYMSHPYYKYRIYILKDDFRYYCSLLVIRKINFKNSNVLRLVDYQGNENLLSKIYMPLQKLLILEKSEFIDFYQHGISNKILSLGGFVNVNENNIIAPNYFEPFVSKNIKLNFAHKSLNKNKKIYFFKGDGDQDRPNQI